MRFCRNIFLLAFLLLAVSCCRKEEEVTFSMVHYNVGVFSKTDDSSMDAVVRVFKELGADLVSLNELDSCALRTGNVDQLALLADAMGDWNSHFAPAMPFMGGKYGVGVASRLELEVLKTYSIKLPRLTGSEPRAVAVVEFRDFVYASTHLDFTSADVQIKQMEVIDHHVDSLYAGSSKPFILCGDFNCLPESAPISYMKRSWIQLSGDSPSYPADSPSKCIDYIFIRPNGRTIISCSSRTPASLSSSDLTTTSDHLPVHLTLTFR